MIERHVSLPPLVSGEFLCFSLTFVTLGANSCFTRAIRPLPSLYFPLEDLGGSLVLAPIKHRFHAPTCRVNVWNNHIFTFSTNLVPQF
jgi:hypothetical protein